MLEHEATVGAGRREDVPGPDVPLAYGEPDVCTRDRRVGLVDDEAVDAHSQGERDFQARLAAWCDLDRRRAAAELLDDPRPSSDLREPRAAIAVGSRAALPRGSHLETTAAQRPWRRRPGGPRGRRHGRRAPEVPPTVAVRGRRVGQSRAAPSVAGHGELVDRDEARCTCSGRCRHVAVVGDAPEASRPQPATVDQRTSGDD